MNHNNNNNKSHLLHKENFDTIFSTSSKIYAREVLDRAIPNLFDGLKQVQRRILYIIVRDFSKDHFIKSAKVLGRVLGELHPHGQLSVYGAIIKLIQWFYVRNPFLIGQGNFGSMDGNDWADSRYTEIKRSNFLLYNIEEFNKQIMDFIPNFDETLLEPTELPFILPNILLNGSKGIGFGYMSSFPPHNLKDVINTLLLFLDSKIQNNNIKIEDLIKTLRSPDFPTGGSIIVEEVDKCYQTGLGSIKILSNYKFENDQQLIITNIPFLSKKTLILNDVYEKIQNNLLKHIIAIRDESDYKHKIRIVVFFKSNSTKDEVLRELFTKTLFIQTFSFCSYFLVDGKPKLFNIKDILTIFVDKKIKYYYSLIKHRIWLINEKIFKLETILKIKEHINIIIKLMENLNEIDLNKELTKLDFNTKQIKIILDTKLRSLMKTNIINIQQELSKLLKNREQNFSYIKNDQSLLRYYKTIIRNLEDKVKRDKQLVHLFTRQTILLKKTELQYIVSKKSIRGHKKFVICLTSLGLIFKISYSTLDENIVNTKNIKKQGQKINYNDIFGKIIYSKLILDFQNIVIICKNGELRHLEIDDIPCLEDVSSAKKHLLNITKFNLNTKDVVTFLTLNNDKKYLYVLTRKGRILKLISSLSKKTKRIVSLKENDSIIFAKFGNEGVLGIILNNNKLLLRYSKDISARKSKTSMGLKLLSYTVKNNIEILDGDFIENSNKTDIIVLLLYEKGYIFSINSKYLKFNKNRGVGRVLSKKHQIQTIMLMNDCETEDYLLFTKYNKIIKMNQNLFPNRKNKSALGNKSNISLFIK